jgi:hypothetical protein
MPDMPSWPEAALPWSTWWQWLTRRGCRSRYRGPTYRGRCELVRGHDCDHALERGMDTPRWRDPAPLGERRRGLDSMPVDPPRGTGSAAAASADYDG